MNSIASNHNNDNNNNLNYNEIQSSNGRLKHQITDSKEGNNNNDDRDKNNKIEDNILEDNHDSQGNKNNNDLTEFEKLKSELINNQQSVKDAANGKRIGFYSVGKELGSGNFSQVRLGIHLLTKDRVAIKILDKTKLDEKTQRLLFREITSMEKLHHPNIIRLYEVINTNTRLYICMEYAAKGELYTKINQFGKLDENYSKLLFSQIIAAVDHMHSHNIIHRDIKAENVFFSHDNLIKVGDFGFSTQASKDQQLNTFCGSPPYAAPELFCDDSYIGVYVDMWALGVLLYFMVTAQMPFKADTVGRLKRCIINGEYTIPSYVSDECQLLVRGILKQIPADRFTIKEIMESAWFDGENFPQQLEPYQLTPTLDKSELKKEEKLARQHLEKLGINQSTLLRSRKESDIKKFENNLLFVNNNSSNNENIFTNSYLNTQEFRHSIDGTYRIIYHRIQRDLRKKRNFSEQNSIIFNNKSNLERQNSSNQLKIENNDTKPLKQTNSNRQDNNSYQYNDINSNTIDSSNSKNEDQNKSKEILNNNNSEIKTSLKNNAFDYGNLIIKSRSSYEKQSSLPKTQSELVNRKKDNFDGVNDTSHNIRYAVPSKFGYAKPTNSINSHIHSNTDDKYISKTCNIL